MYCVTHALRALPHTHVRYNNVADETKRHARDDDNADNDNDVETHDKYPSRGMSEMSRGFCVTHQ